MVSVPHSRLSGLGSSPGQGHCVVPPSTLVYKWLLGNLMLGVTFMTN